MGFEYDPDKSAENKRKHGIDFEAAQRLWADAKLVEIPARTSDETPLVAYREDRREALVGDHHSARRQHSIDFREAITDEEVELYESENL